MFPSTVGQVTPQPCPIYTSPTLFPQTPPFFPGPTPPPARPAQPHPLPLPTSLPFPHPLPFPHTHPQSHPTLPPSLAGHTHTHTETTPLIHSPWPDTSSLASGLQPHSSSWAQCIHSPSHQS